jgi:hypothetical protein
MTQAAENKNTEQVDPKDGQGTTSAEVAVSKPQNDEDLKGIVNVEVEVEEASPSNKAREEQTQGQPDATFLYKTIELFFTIIQASIAATWLGFAALMRYVLRHPIHALVTLSLLVMLGLLVVTGANIHKQMILARISDQTVTKIIRSSRFTRNFNGEQIQAGNITKEFLRVGAPEWAQREGVRAILFNARKSGLGIEDQAVLLAIAEIESGFNPMAKAESTSACGLFQFVKKTGEQFGLAQENCMNPWLNAMAGVQHYMVNYQKRVQDSVTEVFGPERLFRTFEISYYMHHDGPASSNPSNDVKAIVVTGTAFLFKVYQILQRESESQAQEPSFAEEFSENFWGLVDLVSRYVTGSPFTAEAQAKNS